MAMKTYKLCVSIPGKSLKIDMPQPDAEVWFATLTEALLNTQLEEDAGDKCGYEDTADSENDPEKTGEPEATSETAPPKSVIDIKETRSRLPCEQADQDEREGYKGFLRIRCDVCGEIRGFNTKKPLCRSWCPCGEYTPLVELDEIYAVCSVCGHTWHYRTNNTDPLDEITCLKCGAPITLERDKHGNYQTIGMK